MTAETVSEQIQTLKGHVCCYTEEEVDALVDAIRAELRAQIAAERDMCRHRQEQTR